MDETFSWQKSYQEAMLELNLPELPAKIRRAVTELREREKELLLKREAASLAEWQAISDALNNLSAIARSELASDCEPRQRNGDRQGAL